MVDIGKGKQAWLCSTCKRYLMQDRMPPMCDKNHLTIITEPELTTPLSELEASLISPTILFMKIFPLKTSRWTALDGKVINVPIRPEDTKHVMQALTSLPRTPEQAGFITVELKRKLEYKNTHFRPQLVNLPNLFKWLKHLKKAGNPYFKNIIQNAEDYEEHCAQSDPRGFRSLFPDIQDNLTEEQNTEHILNNKEGEEDDIEEEENDNDEEDERDYQQNDPVKKNQFTYNQSLCMNDTHPEMNRRVEDSVVSLAPGEGKVPVNMLYDHDWDVKAFPHLNNLNGKNGMFDPDRPTKLTSQQFFAQRILNCDQRFSKNAPYLYAAVIHTEKNQIRRNMALSYTTGHQVVGGNGKVSLHQHDAFSVLNNIKNSPKFWKQKKNELLAKLDNFGPFHWFFTLSSADRRWENNFSAILRQLPGVTAINITNHSNTKTGYSSLKIIVHSKDREPLELKEFIKTLTDSEHQLIRDNVLTATRVFDQRVKTFIKSIIMGKGNPMYIQFYTYRVEFQQRGAGHVHGCLWMDMEKMDEKIPDLKKAYEKLRHDQDLKDTDDIRVMEGKQIPNHIKALTTMIDSFTTCSLHPGSVGGQEVVDIVEAVQKHCHTKSCRKRETICRFNYPKFPSVETIICKPVKTDKERQELVKAELALGRVRDVLNDKELMEKEVTGFCPEKGVTREEYEENRRTRIKKLCEIAGVDYDDYKRYLRMSRSGYSVVLQRDTDEIFINAYNSEWIRAWNGNLDLQPVLDFFAIITYVTEYAFKPEPEEGVIREALEKCKDEDMKTPSRLHARWVRQKLFTSSCQA